MIKVEDLELRKWPMSHFPMILYSTKQMSSLIMFALFHVFQEKFMDNIVACHLSEGSHFGHVRTCGGLMFKWSSHNASEASSLSDLLYTTSVTLPNTSVLSRDQPTCLFGRISCIWTHLGGAGNRLKCPEMTANGQVFL